METLKKLLVFAFLVALIAIAGSCYADTVADHTADALTGKNQYIETNIYVAKTISLEKTPYLNVLNADLRVKLSTPIGDNSFRSGILEVGLEF